MTLTVTQTVEMALLNRQAIFVIFIVKLINLLLSLFATGYYSGEIKIFIFDFLLVVHNNNSSV